MSTYWYLKEDFYPLSFTILSRIKQSIVSVGGKSGWQVTWQAKRRLERGKGQWSIPCCYFPNLIFSKIDSVNWDLNVDDFYADIDRLIRRNPVLQKTVKKSMWKENEFHTLKDIWLILECSVSVGKWYLADWSVQSRWQHPNN